MYHFFEGVQGNFLNCGLWIGIQVCANYTEAFALKQLGSLCALWGIGCLQITFFEDFGRHLDPQSNLCHSHCHHLSSCTTATIAHHGTMPNNPNQIPTSINFSLQQLIITTVNIPPTIDAPTFADLVGEFFWVFELEFSIKTIEIFLQLATFSRKRMKPLRCFTRSFSSLKRILKTSQTWKLPIDIFVHWKVFRHSMCRFCNRFL